MDTEDKYVYYCTKTVGVTEAWIEPWQIQESFCTVNSVYRASFTIKPSVT